MKTVMLIDDERATSDLLRMFLELDGFTVIVCPTLELARAQLTADVDTVIIDRNLGQDVNGTELLRDIRAGETVLPADAPVIMTSGDDRREAEAQEAGATHFMLKPFSPTDLSAYLSSLLS